MSEEPKTVLTTGRLDGLCVTPMKDETGVCTHVHFTVDTLPGLRLIIEADAVRELHYALGIVLCDNPDSTKG